MSRLTALGVVRGWRDQVKREKGVWIWTIVWRLHGVGLGDMVEDIKRINGNEKIQ